jgi:hypothetical protein
MLKVIGGRAFEIPYTNNRSHVFTGADGWETTQLLPYEGRSHVQPA